MPEWSIDLETRHTLGQRRMLDVVYGLLDRLTKHAAVASAGRRTLGVRFNIVAAEPDRAMAMALQLFTRTLRRVGFPGRPEIVSVELETVTEQARRLKEPTLPPFAGISEVAKILGVTRQRAHQLAQTAGFPQPLAMLAAGPIWNRHAIDRFSEDWNRRPGRPKKASVMAGRLLSDPTVHARG